MKQNTQRRIFIGDVHGHYDALMLLLDLIAPGDEDRIFFLGDLINRGSQSAQVVEFVKESSYNCLLGNHEQMLLNFFRAGKVSNQLVKIWFELNPQMFASYAALGRTKLLDHLAWLRNLPTYLDLGDIWLVHAGVDPRLPIDKQTSKQFCWIREKFHRISEPYFPNKLMIIGHTMTFTFPGVQPGQLVTGHGWLDIDTGAYHPESGWLTGVDMSSRKVYQTNVFERKSRILSLEEVTVEIEYPNLWSRMIHNHN